MSYPTLFTTPGVRQFAEEIDAERQKQIAKFGDQRHPDGTGLPIYQHSASRYRDHANRAAEGGVLAWRDVLLEEVHEALAESDPARLRAELVQVAAVCAAWLSDLDRRPAEDGVVAYRSPGGSVLRCLLHAPDQSLIDHGNFRPVASEDLPDGGVCTYPGCGVDVLIAPRSAPAAGTA